MSTLTLKPIHTGGRHFHSQLDAVMRLYETTKSVITLRTTLTLDPDIMSAARQIAAAKSKNIGEVISDLARRGLEARAKVGTRQLPRISGRLSPSPGPAPQRETRHRR